MDNFDISEFEKHIKGIKLREPSDRFFANVERELSGVTQLDSLEASLKKLKPIEPSEEFYEKIAGKLEAENAPHSTQDNLMFFSRWISVAAALALAATGILIWQHPENENGDGYSQIAENTSYNFEEKPNYKLVSTESSLNEVEELPIETREDGTLVRPVRYVYTNTKRWEDPKTNKHYVERRPYEKVVPTLVAVY